MYVLESYSVGQHATVIMCVCVHTIRESGSRSAWFDGKINRHVYFRRLPLPLVLARALCVLCDIGCGVMLHTRSIDCLPKHMLYQCVEYQIHKSNGKIARRTHTHTHAYRFVCDTCQPFDMIVAVAVACDWYSICQRGEKCACVMYVKVRASDCVRV